MGKRSKSKRRDQRRPLGPAQRRVVRFVSAAISPIVGIVLLFVGLSNGINFGINEQPRYVASGWFAMAGLVMIVVAALCQFGKGPWYHSHRRDRSYPHPRYRCRDLYADLAPMRTRRKRS